MRKERTPAITHPFKSKLLLLDNKTVWALKSNFKKNNPNQKKKTTIKKQKKKNTKQNFLNQNFKDPLCKI